MRRAAPIVQRLDNAGQCLPWSTDSLRETRLQKGLTVLCAEASGLHAALPVAVHDAEEMARGHAHELWVVEEYLCAHGRRSSVASYNLASEQSTLTSWFSLLDGPPMSVALAHEMRTVCVSCTHNTQKLQAMLSGHWQYSPHLPPLKHPGSRRRLECLPQSEVVTIIAFGVREDLPADEPHPIYQALQPHAPHRAVNRLLSTV